jgi:hypothetical protein
VLYFYLILIVLVAKSWKIPKEIKLFEEETRVEEITQNGAKNEENELNLYRATMGWRNN